MFRLGARKPLRESSRSTSATIPETVAKEFWKLVTDSPETRENNLDHGRGLVPIKPAAKSRGGRAPLATLN